MSLIARHLEANGTPTVCIASALDIVEAGNPPRAAFVDYPLGHGCGKPHDADDQLTIVRQALLVLESATVPGTVTDLGKVWGEAGWRERAMNRDGGDSREKRDTTPQYQFDADRIAAEG